jgi:hypothetical protein
LMSAMLRSVLQLVLRGLTWCGVIALRMLPRERGGGWGGGARWWNVESAGDVESMVNVESMVDV